VREREKADVAWAVARYSMTTTATSLKGGMLQRSLRERGEVFLLRSVTHLKEAQIFSQEQESRFGS
jgi:hypothetical protein